MLFLITSRCFIGCSVANLLYFIVNAYNDTVASEDSAINKVVVYNLGLKIMKRRI